MTDTLPKGIRRDDTEHGELYFTEAQMREAMAQAEALRARVAELEAKLAKPVAWQKAILRAEEWGMVIIGWEFCTESEYRSLLIPKRALVDAAIAAKEQDRG